MPWKVFEIGSKFEVFKIDASGDRVGSSLGTHKTHTEAQAQVRALNANVEEAARPDASDTTLLEDTATGERAQDTPPDSLRTQYFAEAVTFEENSIDAKNHGVRVTLIQPGWSANNRHYSAKVLGEAAPLFEGVKAYADHPTKLEDKQRPERSVRDITGWYEDVRQENDGRLTATRRVVGDAKNWLWPLIETAATEKPDLLGLSINALGKARKGEVDGRKGTIVEVIAKANSADDVTTPAAGGQFESLLMSSGDTFTSDLLDVIEIDELREARPDIIVALKKEWQTPRDSAALVSAREEVDSLQKKLEEAKKELAEVRTADRTHKQELDALHKTHQRAKWTSWVDLVLANTQAMPEDWKRAIRSQLLECESVEEAEAILKTEIAKVKAVKGSVPIRVPGKPTSPPPAPSRRLHPVAGALGLSEVAPRGVTPEQWKARKEAGANEPHKR